MIGRWWRHPVWVGLSVGVGYLLTFVSVTAVEYRSETAKLATGAFTDTFDALAFSRLLTFPNVLITAHQAFLTQEALSEIARVTATNLAAFANGQPFLPETALT